MIGDGDCGETGGIKIGRGNQAIYLLTVYFNLSNYLSL
jgi:hypothetical protein